MTTAQTAATIRNLGTSIIAFADALAHADEIQYDRPAAPSQRQEDTSRQASGTISNPTADARRLRVRAAVISGEIAAQRMTTQADELTAELRAALQRWAGDRF